MPYQTASLPRPARLERPRTPVVPVERVRPRTIPDPSGLEGRLAETEVALAAATRRAAVWEARARALQGVTDARSAQGRSSTEPLPRGLPPALAACLALVTTATAIAPSDLASPTRRMPVAKARQILFFISRRTTRLGLAAIGAPFGRRHGTVLHGVRRVARIARAIGLEADGDPGEAVRRLAAADWREIESL